MIINHYDCDGLTSGAIVYDFLMKNGKMPKIMTLKKLKPENIAGFATSFEEVVFVDLGSNLPAIKEIKSALTIDHHQTEELDYFQANPMLHGVDGGSEISSSGVAYLVCNSESVVQGLESRNPNGPGSRVQSLEQDPDMSQTCHQDHYVELALVGALGDMQYPLVGMNRLIADQGIKAGRIDERIDLTLFGKHARSVRSMLLYADPYLPGITGNEELCKFIIESSGITKQQGTKWASYYDCSEEERKRLVSSLVRFLAEGGYGKLAKSLIGPVYLLPKLIPELREAQEFSAMLNACGRNGRFDLGMQLCSGSFTDEAANLLAKHRKNLRDGISFAFSNVQDMGTFHLIDGRGAISESIIGVVCGMLYASAKKDKPIIGLSIDEENEGIKISSRAAKFLVESGVNLGTAMKECAASVGGIGGGHRMAAGATIPKEKLEEFLVLLNQSL
jgi:RecJ-like exonuclease